MAILFAGGVASMAMHWIDKSQQPEVKMSIHIEDIQDIGKWIDEAVADLPAIYRENAKMTLSRMDEREKLLTLMKFRELSTTGEKIKRLWDYSLNK